MENSGIKPTIRFYGRIHRDIKPVNGFYTINYKGEPRDIGEKYFNFVAESMEEILETVDFTQIESFRIKYDEFNDFNWSSGGD